MNCSESRGRLLLTLHADQQHAERDANASNEASPFHQDNLDCLT
ncbi:hypothetical protein [Paenibacillus luteus]|nr:hypothetical protein [Paenibacillus luteus]